MEKVLKKMA